MPGGRGGGEVRWSQPARPAVNFGMRTPRKYPFVEKLITGVAARGDWFLEKLCDKVVGLGIS